MENKLSKGVNNPPKPVSSDPSIFHGKKEISRSDFRKALKINYQGSGMNVSERIKIEKKDFPSFYGRNISKSSLQAGIHRLNQKMLSTKDPAEHIKIRKEIDYLKRIGRL